MLSPIATYSDHYHHDLDGSASSTMSRSARRGPWLPEEDQALLQLVRSQGANNWVRISQQIQHRSPKQCRERYHQNLKPSLKHDPISAHEGEMIEQLVQEMGKRWAEIARRLGNRSDNAVKNWWNGSVNRRRRNPSQHTVSTGFKQVGSRLQPVPFTIPSEPSYAPHSQTVLEPQHSTQPTSQRTRRDFTRQHKPPHLRAPPPGHAQDPLVSTPTTTFEHDNWNMKLSHTSPGQSMTLAKYENMPLKVHTHEQRPELPPIRVATSHLERHNSGMERTPISPALSNTSQRHTPSLVPDDQSSCSVSPRTITTPYMSSTSPSESAIWSDYQTMAQKSKNSGLHKHKYNSNSYSGQDSRTTTDHRQQCRQIHSPRYPASEDRLKDVRMNVSTLLQ